MLYRDGLRKPTTDIADAEFNVEDEHSAETLVMFTRQSILSLRSIVETNLPGMRATLREFFSLLPGHQHDCGWGIDIVAQTVLLEPDCRG